MNLKKFLKKNDLNKLYVSGWLRFFGISVIAVFIPIYLLNLGYSLREVSVFYIFVSFFHIVFTIIGGRVIKKYGLRFVLLTSIPFRVIFFFLLFSLEFYPISLVFLAFVFGTSNGLYWVGRLTLLAKNTEEHKRGSQLAINGIIKKVVTLPGPIIGGFLLSFTNISIAIIFVLIFLILSFIPVFYLKDEKEDVDLKIKNIFKGLNWREKLIIFNKGIDDIMNTIVWPVFAFFFILHKYFVLGLVKFVEKMFLIISDYFSGKLFDKKGSIVIKYGGFFSIILWIGRALVQSSFGVYLVDSFRGLVAPFILNGFDAECMELANTQDEALHFMIAREILMHSGRIFLLIILFMVNDLKTVFIFGILYSLIYVFIKFDGNRATKDVELEYES
ncbi:MAG: MFS transporter [Patescibacteria group bacterium]|nr:MFS transporter [Patescibacteria group bacterium]